MMEIYGTIHFRLILPHIPGFQQELSLIHI